MIATAVPTTGRAVGRMIAVTARNSNGHRKIEARNNLNLSSGKRDHRNSNNDRQKTGSNPPSLNSNNVRRKTRGNNRLNLISAGKTTVRPAPQASLISRNKGSGRINPSKIRTGLAISARRKTRISRREGSEVENEITCIISSFGGIVLLLYHSAPESCFLCPIDFLSDIDAHFVLQPAKQPYLCRPSITFSTRHTASKLFP